MFSSMTINFEGSGTYYPSIYLDRPQKTTKILNTKQVFQHINQHQNVPTRSILNCLLASFHQN